MTGRDVLDDIEEAGITVERHSHDGFTFWWSDDAGNLCHFRYIDYTLEEAFELWKERNR